VISWLDELGEHDLALRRHPREDCTVELRAEGLQDHRVVVAEDVHPHAHYQVEVAVSVDVGHIRALRRGGEYRLREDQLSQ